MDDYFGGLSMKDLEARLRQLIAQGAEGPKVDFKSLIDWSDKNALAELAKDLSSIANTDDEGHFDDFGYIIVGARRGELLGGVAEFAGDIDKFQAQLTEKLKGFLGPLPQFFVVQFMDSTLGHWGAIVLSPSARQPHMLIRDAAGLVKHEWWVRANDTNERAGVHDYARLLSKAARREVRPLERELQRLAMQLEQQAHVASIPVPSSAQDTIENDRDAASGVRAFLLRDGVGRLEDQLVQSALSVAAGMRENSPEHPWNLIGANSEKLQRVLVHVEDQTFAFANALATAVRYDRAGLLTDSICRALRIVAREPAPTGPHWPKAPQFRLYSLALCIYPLTMVSVQENRGELLRRVFEISFTREDRDEVAPIIEGLRRLRHASELFRSALGRVEVEPVALRIQQYWVQRFAALVVDRSVRDAFAVTEFVLSLALIPATRDRIPLPGRYLYDEGSLRPVVSFLRQRPEWIGAALNMPMAELLQNFDQKAGSIINNNSWPDGFTNGALDAYEGRTVTYG